MKTVTYNAQDKAYTFECPHCDMTIQVLEHETCCCIFRHGIYKTNMKQVGPHTGKTECDRLIAEDLVFGCCKPFKFIKGDSPTVEVCDYI